MHTDYLTIEFKFESADPSTVNATTTLKKEIDEHINAGVFKAPHNIAARLNELLDTLRKSQPNIEIRDVLKEVIIHYGQGAGPVIALELLMAYHQFNDEREIRKIVDSISIEDKELGRDREIELGSDSPKFI